MSSNNNNNNNNNNQQEQQQQQMMPFAPMGGAFYAYQPSNKKHQSLIKPEVVSLQPPSTVKFTAQEFRGKTYMHIRNGKSFVSLKENEFRDVAASIDEIVSKMNTVAKQIDSLNIKQQDDNNTNFTLIPHVESSEDEPTDTLHNVAKKKRKRKQAVKRAAAKMHTKVAKKKAKVNVVESDEDECQDESEDEGGVTTEEIMQAEEAEQVFTTTHPAKKAKKNV
jgi:hypothetical protein